MSSLFDWSATASSNTACDGISTATGMSPANVDNVFRSLMALVRNSFASALQNFLAGSAPLPIANGGTAATTAVDALAALGGLSVSYCRLIYSGKSAAFSPAAGESGYGYNYSGAAAALTLTPNSIAGRTAGDTFVVRNGGTGALSVTRGAAVDLYVNGSTTSSDGVIALGGVCMLTCWGGDVWTANGTGVS